MQFEIIDHPADIGFRAKGKTLEETFENAGIAMYFLLVYDKTFGKDVKIDFEIEAEDLPALNYDYLEHLLILFDTESFVAEEIDVSVQKKKNSYLLRARLGGNRIDGLLVERQYDVKAVTYHMMEVKKVGMHWIIQVIVDI
ncbi:MAG: archease [Candidatus Methanofastidiosia archaeon]